ncbi:DUF6973 domain-containing protein [Paracoccus jiaweipingae]|uniref:DUF6973 domain-containing protein n=1 Tax=unclassified Paracoccus (in: a-proteobacteria) TaxID=2688777 RepID=UPI00379F2861
MFDHIRNGMASLLRPRAPRPAALPASRPLPHSGSGSASGRDGGPDRATGRAGSGSVDGMRDAAQGTVDGARIRDGIDKLNSAGDSAFLRMTPEAKVQGSLRVGKVGVKSQLGSQLTVIRDSDAPDSSYTVRYDKQSLLAATGEVGTDALGRGKAAATAGSKSVGANLKAEAGAQGFDVVEMKFDNKEDAIRATQALQRLQQADMLDDSMDLAASGLTPGLPGFGPKPSTISGGGDNPAANPLNKDGAPGRISESVAGVDRGDMDFLRDHISAYETTIGSRARLAAEVKGDLKLLDGALEGRLDGTQRITRRVEMPTADADGRVTYSVSGGLRLSAKERANRGAGNLGKKFSLPDVTNAAGKTGVPGGLTLKADNRLELGQASVTASLHYTLPKGTTPTTSGGGRPVPERDALSGDTPMQLDAVTLENRLEYRTQGLTDLSRGDSAVVTEKLTADNPQGLKDAAGQFFSGDFKGAAETADARLDLGLKTIDRSGVDVQPGFKLDAVVGDVEGSVILASGVNDVTGSKTITIQPGKDAVPGTTDTHLPPAPLDDGKTFAVQPYVGAHIRHDPQGDSAGVIQSGSFLRDAGGRRTDAEGHEWMQVSGTDRDDAPVTGWMRADLLTQHSSATGAMDDQGRINPTAEHNRMDKITVQQDDNLWNLAREHGWDYDATVAANRDHLQNPSLIFKGDTVYVPGSARGPKPEQVTTPGTPATPSVQTESSGDTGSVIPGLSGSASGDPAASGTGTPPATGSGPAPTLSPATPASGPAQPRPTSPATPPVAPQGTTPANAPAQPGPVPGRPDLGGILRDFQVNADRQTRDWQPDTVNGFTEGLVNAGDFVMRQLPGDHDLEGAKDAIAKLKRSAMPAAEADMLDQLGPMEQLRWAKMTKDTMDQAPGAIDKPAGFTGNSGHWQNDGHVDAYRHALWNARMTRAFGEGWTRNYATGHEMIAANPAQREAMDLYNNSIGRQIAVDNPHASDADLQRLVRQALDKGDLVVIDRNLELAWSDQVAVGAHGFVPHNAAEAAGNPAMAPDAIDTASGW